MGITASSIVEDFARELSEIRGCMSVHICFENGKATGHDGRQFDIETPNGRLLQECDCLKLNGDWFIPFDMGCTSKLVFFLAVQVAERELGLFGLSVSSLV
jgi:hypothetical protein